MPPRIVQCTLVDHSLVRTGAIETSWVANLFTHMKYRPELYTVHWLIIHWCEPQPFLSMALVWTNLHWHSHKVRLISFTYSLIGPNVKLYYTLDKITVKTRSYQKKNINRAGPQGPNFQIEVSSTVHYSSHQEAEEVQVNLTLEVFVFRLFM